MGDRLRLVTACIVLAAVLATPVAGQIVLEDRRLEGHVGFVNGVLGPPGILIPDEILARSIGADPPFNNVGIVVEDPLEPPTRRAHEVVVQAFGGDYWLSALLRLENGQRYRFGYAAHLDEPPGYPNFQNEVYRPITQEVTDGHPPVIADVDLLECTGLARVHFIEEDPGAPGTWRTATRTISSVIVTASPRKEPLDSTPPFEYLGGSISSLRDGPQAEATYAFGSGAHLWVRSSAQSDGGEPEPAVRYRIGVDWTQACSTRNPDCPAVSPNARRFSAVFEGGVGTLGTFSGGLSSDPGLLPGIEVACDEILDLYVDVTPCAPPPCPDADPDDDGGTLRGCVNLIGERELFIDGKTLVRGGGVPDADNIGNIGDRPDPYSDLFLRFDPTASEGIYDLDGVGGTPGAAMTVRTQMELGEDPSLPGASLIRYGSHFVDSVIPAEGAVADGPDFCMVPGIYSGTLRLVESSTGGSVGALRDMVPRESFFFARSGQGSSSLRLFGGLSCDPITGQCLLPYENVFGNPEHQRDQWAQDVQHHAFENLSAQPALFSRGKSQLSFLRPRAAVTWDPLDYISLAAGGRWTDELDPGTEIAARPFRLIPTDYELCYATLRIQVLSSDVLFFEPRITTYGGDFLDDRGTPTPLDDLEYRVVAASPWEGSPRTIDDAANEGFVVLHLPAADYRGLSGFITTVLGGGLTGTTQLPTLDVDLACGQSCTARPNAIVCLNPIELCNDPDVLDDDRIAITGLLGHQEEIAAGYWRINDGAQMAIDLVEAGVTCAPSPCTDEFAVEVQGFENCRNDIEVTFVDALGEPISAFLTTTVDSAPPSFHDPDAPDEPYPCGTEMLHFVPCGSNRGVRLDPPLVRDDCSSEGDPEQPLLVEEDWPDKFLLGTTVASVEAFDACGNAATCEVTVIVAEEGGEPSCPAPLVLDCEGPDGIGRDDSRIQAWLAQAQGDCGADVVNDAPEVFPVGCGPEDVTTVTFTSADGATSCVSTVSVVDALPPELLAPEPLALPCSSPEGLPADDPAVLAWLASAIATDLCSAPTIVHDAPAVFPSGCDGGVPTVVTFTATDACGNATSASSTLTVFDDEPPTLSVPAPLALECSGPDGVPATDPRIQDWLAEALAVDACGGVVLTHDAPSAFPSGCEPGTVTAVTFAAVDDCGHRTELSSTITVVDTTAPDLSVPPPLVLECPSPAGVPLDDPRIQDWLALAGGVDLCGGVSLSDDAPTAFPSGCAPGTTTTVTFTAVDDCGNATVLSSTVTVQDTTAPELVVPEPLTLECRGPGGIPIDDPAVQAFLAQATASDLCGDVTLSDDAPALLLSGCPPGAVTTVTFTATDDCGLETTMSSTITVVDTLPPTLTVPPPLVLECTSPEGRPLDDPEIQAWLALATAYDLCGNVSLSHDAPDAFPSGCPPGVATVVTFTAVDDCGHAVSESSSVTIVDTTPPVIDRQPSLGEPCAILWPPRHGYATFSLEDTGIEAHDLCGGVRLEFAGCVSSQPEDNEGDENSGDGGDGNTACDCATSPDGQTVALRAERNGGCAPLGRTYTLWVDAIDDCGNRTRAEPIVVCVPHDRRGLPGGKDGVYKPERRSRVEDDYCLVGWTNGSYPEPSSGEPVCGEGCESACAENPDG